MPDRRHWVRLAPPVLAVCLGVAALVLGWRGGDLPASLYRVGLFQREGLTIWDSQWYGGHWTLGYSVIFPPIAGILGVSVTVVLTAGAAALAFDRLVIGHFGRAATAGSLLFAAGTVGQIAIGQLPFLMGEAFALLACWAAARGRWVLAVGLAAATSLASPMAGAFLGLALVSWVIAEQAGRRRGLATMIAAVLIPAGTMLLLFPGTGTFPYPARDFVIELAGCAALWLLVPRTERVLRAAAPIYMVVIAATFVLPNPVGSNVARLGECVAVPLVACLIGRRHPRVIASLLAPLALWQWTPAWSAITQNGKDPSTHESYYTALDQFLRTHAQPIGRVEVVPTKLHWESVYVAPTAELARGWERQLDTATNPIFYSDDGSALTPASYRDWLIAAGARYVALSDAPLDYAAVDEARLVNEGVPGVDLVWHDAHWRVFEVRASTGIVTGPANAVSVDGGDVVLHVTGPGDIVLRVRYSNRWSVVDGQATLAPGQDGWTSVTAPGPEDLHLQLQLLK